MTTRAITSLTAMLAVLLVTTSPASEAQSTSNIPRIGFLVGAVAEGEPGPEAFRQGLREFGYVEGQNIAIEWRWARGDLTRLPDLAQELVQLKVDVIVANSVAPIRAAQKATRTIPIVMVYPADPVALGFVASLARPEGNITGLTQVSPELIGKRLQLLKEAVPNLSRVAVLLDPGHPGIRQRAKDAKAAAPALGLRLQFVEAQNSSELDTAFAAMTRENVNAVFYEGSTRHYAQRARIAQHAVKNRLPSMCGLREYVEAGCLMGYGARWTDLWRRAAYFVDKILRGAKPPELPVEGPTKFEFVINMRTAKALGLTIPPSLLLRADHVIE
jgi:putative ABC transport system substrate-binding protein